MWVVDKTGNIIKTSNKGGDTGESSWARKYFSGVILNFNKKKDLKKKRKNETKCQK